ncbi:MAG: DUF3040 domain-containing protein [Kineosporiaceae bacterium]
MPLSENEQRLLEQMERALSAEDPKFASAMRGGARAIGARRRLLLGGLGVCAGLVVLLVGVTRGGTPGVVFGVVGFVLMLAGTAYAASSQRRPGPTGVVAADGKVARPAARGRSRGRSSSFMQRMEERWDRREN